MADQPDRGGQQPTDDPRKTEHHQGNPAPAGSSPQAERDRQNNDDPSRAPESGDRK